MLLKSKLKRLRKSGRRKSSKRSRGLQRRPE
jgi:hypothetical protein